MRGSGWGLNDKRPSWRGSGYGLHDERPSWRGSGWGLNDKRPSWRGSGWVLNDKRDPHDEGMDKREIALFITVRRPFCKIY